MIGLSYKQKCNNFGYHSNEVQSKGNDSIHPNSDSKQVQLNWISNYLGFVLDKLYFEDYLFV